MLRKIGTSMAIAATLIAVSAGVWRAAQPKSLFARTVRSMLAAQGYRCDIVEVRRGADGLPKTSFDGYQYWSNTNATRFESIEEGKVTGIDIRHPAESGLYLLPPSRQYRIQPEVMREEFTFGLFTHLADYKGNAGPPVKIEVMDGRQVEQYVVPWSKVIAENDHADSQMRMWLDPLTSLPVRVDLEGLGPKEGDVSRLENFHWGIQEAHLFDTTIPPGYAKLPTKDFQADEITSYVVFGLMTFAKYNNGVYPTVKYVYGDEQGEALRKRMEMDDQTQGWRQPVKGQPWDKTKADEFAHGSYGMSWINSLQREQPEFKYNGKSVTRRNPAKVLLRWKRRDGRYQVIFGDLKTETVSADRLKTLEAR